jgi:hypothetical protein
MKKTAGSGLAFIFLLVIVWMASGQDQKPEKPWLMPQDQINAVVNAVRAGKGPDSVRLAGRGQGRGRAVL